MTIEKNCPACEGTGGVEVGSEPYYLDLGDGYGSRLAGYDPILDYCRCEYGQSLKRAHTERDAWMDEAAALHAEEEAARIDCGGGW